MQKDFLLRGFLDLDAISPKHITEGTQWGDEQRPEQFCSQKTTRLLSVDLDHKGEARDT